MRTLRRSAAVLAAITVLVIPTVANADGGAYIELDRTHHLVGTTATGEAYVSVPAPKHFLLARGPFYVYVMPSRAWIRERRPIPGRALRVGTVTIEHLEGREFELSTSFPVPDLPGGYYNVAICNDPCTIAGFREPLTTEISIVATLREGDLLTENARLHSKTWTLRRQSRKAERTIEDLEARSASASELLAGQLARIQQLERRLEASTFGSRDATANDRPLADAWALMGIGGVAILALVGIALAVVFSRRPTLIHRDRDRDRRIDEEIERLLDPARDLDRPAGAVR